jgi:uncharacterized membrane protein
MYPTETAALPRPAEKVAIVSLILVFLCGGVCGAVLMSFADHSNLLHHPAANSQPALSMSVAEWKSQLGLSDQQAAELTSILDDFAHYYDNVLADGSSRVMQILNPEQRVLFRKMLREHKH